MNNRQINIQQQLQKLRWKLDIAQEFCGYTLVFSVDEFLEHRKKLYTLDPSAYSNYDSSRPGCCMGFCRDGDLVNHDVGRIAIVAKVTNDQRDCFYVYIYHKSNNRALFNKVSNFFRDNFNTGSLFQAGGFHYDVGHLYVTRELYEIKDFLYLVKKNNIMFPRYIKNIILKLCKPILTYKNNIVYSLNHEDFEQTVAHVPSITSSPVRYNECMMEIGDFYFDKYQMDYAKQAYECVTINSSELYKKAQYQIGSILFNYIKSNQCSSIRDHAKMCFPYYYAAGNFQDAPDILRKLFDCMCSNNYNFGSNNITIPLNISVQDAINLADEIFLREQELRAQITRLTSENAKLTKLNKLVVEGNYSSDALGLNKKFGLF